MISSFLTSEVVLTIITAMIGGIGWLGKRMFDKSEKKREEETKERNKRRDDIENRLGKLENDNLMFQSIILGCKKDDCPSKQLLSEYMKSKINNK